MPKSLADGKIKLTLFTAPLEDFDAAALNTGVDIECNILKSDFRLSATTSETVDDTELCADGNAVVFGASNYEGNMTVFRYFKSDGSVDAAADTLWAAAKEKGSHLYLAMRENGRDHEAEWINGDEGEYWHVITDEPQMPSDRGGYIKRTIPLGPQSKTPFVVGGSGSPASSPASSPA